MALDNTRLRLTALRAAGEAQAVGGCFETQQVQAQATKYHHGIRELFTGDNQMIDRLGATRHGVWMIKHIIAPAQRLLYRASGGRVFTSTGAGRKVLLLTTKGRLTGKDRTTPLYYLRDGNRIIICNVNPGFERTNPWVINLRAHPIARLQIGPEIAEYHAREATEAECDLYWPRLIRIWPAYGSHFEKSHQRTIFVLERL